MADGAIQSQGTGLDAMLKLIQAFTGVTETRTGGGFTQTEKTNITPEQQAMLLKAALDSNSGLASVTSGQKAAGLYNSSTGGLLANDLLARLTAQVAGQTASKTTTRTASPSTTKTGGASSNFNKALLGLAAFQKLNAKDKASGKSMLDEVMDPVKAIYERSGYTNLPAGVAEQAAASADPIGALIGALGGGGNSFDALTAAGLGGDNYQTLAPIDWTAFDFGQGAQASADSVSAQDWAAFDEATNEYMQNFSRASDTSTQVAGAAGNTLNLSGVGSAVSNLYSGISALSDSNPNNDVMGGVSTAAGAYGGYNAYQTYQAAQAAKAAAEAAQATSSAASASDAATATASSTSLADFGISAGAGSTLGYVGPIISAFFAPNNPKGEQNPDYRHAVGSAVLNYFGAGWASPIVHEIAQPALDASMEAGTDSMGLVGAVMADPVGAPLSGQYDVGELVMSTLDPANLFGGNPGGSVGATVAAGIDPIGAALGDTGVFSATKDLIDSDPVIKAISGGCFITTAVMKHMSGEFDDNCEELTILRNFRDTYLAAQPGGPALIKEYYATAPAIVEKVSEREDSGQVWKILHRNYISKAVAQIKEGKDVEAFDTYVNMIDWLKELVNG